MIPFLDVHVSLEPDGLYHVRGYVYPQHPNTVESGEEWDEAHLATEKNTEEAAIDAAQKLVDHVIVNKLVEKAVVFVRGKERHFRRIRR